MALIEDRCLVSSREGTEVVAVLRATRRATGNYQWHPQACDLGQGVASERVRESGGIVRAEFCGKARLGGPG